MQIEHPLNEQQVKYIKVVNEAQIKQRREYLIGLGIAKEAEQITNRLQCTLNEILELIVQEAKLPASVAGYGLSADFTKLIGETADVLPAPAAPAITVNGHAAEGRAHA
jgi:hypothetical protein